MHTHTHLPQILLSGEQDWIPNSNDPYLFLSSLSAACDSSACPEHAVRLVELVAGAVTAALLDRHQVREEVREVLGLTRKTLSLQEILGELSPFQFFILL